MKQGLLAFQYEEEKSTTGMTALSGLMTYVELMHVAGLRSSVERRVGLRGGGQGWTDSQIITSLILLNLCPASTIFASLASISFAGSPPRPGPVAGLHRCGSWGRQIPG